MKSIIISILLSILFMIIVYLFSAFIAADFNCINWDVLGRCVAVIFFIISIVLGFAIGSQDKSNSRNG